MTTLDNSDFPEYKVHPDDAELDDEPTLFEEILNDNVEQDSHSDEELDDDANEKPIKQLSEAERKKMEMRNARKKNAEDDSDSDDESMEEVYTEK